MQARANTLDAIFAVELVSLTVTEHAVALAVARRPDRAESWSDGEIRARIAALGASRNLFAVGPPTLRHARGPATVDELRPDSQATEAIGCDSAIDAARHRLADEEAYRRELLRWVSMRHQLRVGRCDVATAVFAEPVARARSARLNDPSVIAAVGLMAIECSVIRRQWLDARCIVPIAPTLARRSATEGDSMQTGLTLAEMGASGRMAELLRELTHASTSRRAVRPVMTGLRALLGDEQFDRQQRLAVAALEAWRSSAGGGAVW